MWSALVGVVDKLLSLLTLWLVKQEQEGAQNERVVLDSDPAKFYNNHFIGVLTTADADSEETN